MPGDDYTKKILRVSQTFLQIVKSFPYLARFCNFYRSVGLDSCASPLISLDGVNLTRTEHATRGARRKNRFLRAGAGQGLERAGDFFEKYFAERHACRRIDAAAAGAGPVDLRVGRAS
jgi:hypothetical protein